MKRIISLFVVLSFCSFLSAMQTVNKTTDNTSDSSDCKDGLSLSQIEAEQARKEEYLRLLALKVARDAKNKTRIDYGYTHFAIQ